MTEHPFLNPPEMPDESMESTETAVRETARHFVYPPTPDIASATRRRMATNHRPIHALRLAAAVLLMLAILTLAVPEVRAFVLEIIRVGVVEVFFIEPSATPTPTPDATAARPTRTPRPPDPTPVLSALDLSGETTLAQARTSVDFAILLPAYPSDLGQPDHVFVQDFGGTVVTLVWLEPDQPARIRLVLQLLDDEVIASKYYPMEGNSQSVMVNRRQGLWLTDVHQSYFFGRDQEFSRIVNTNVLIWPQSRLTYRLETDLPLEEALQIAASVK